jgi:hypothetical protein
MNETLEVNPCHIIGLYCLVGNSGILLEPLVLVEPGSAVIVSNLHCFKHPSSSNNDLGGAKTRFVQRTLTMICVSNPIASAKRGINWTTRGEYKNFPPTKAPFSLTQSYLCEEKL